MRSQTIGNNYLGPSRRIAGLAPVTMGSLNLEKIQSEQTVIVAGYGVLVVNNQPRNVPNFMPKDGVNGLFIGPLGSNPDIQPYGYKSFSGILKLEKFTLHGLMKMQVLQMVFHG